MIAGEKQACCSFQSYVGSVCTSSRSGKSKATEIVTLLSCNKDISNHKTSLCDPPASIPAAVKWSGVSLVNNVRCEAEGMRVWRAHGVGSGKLLPWEKFDVPNRVEIPTLPIRDQTNRPNATFTAVKPRRQTDSVSRSDGLSVSAESSEISTASDEARAGGGGGTSG